MARGKRVEIVKIIVDGVEVDAKACTKCGEVKALGEFHAGRGMCRRQPACRNCRALEARVRTETSSQKGSEAEVRHRWNAGKYAEHVAYITGGDYCVIGDYVNCKTKILHKHLKCDYTWPVRPTNFLHNGTRCPMCAVNSKMTHSGYVRLVRELSGREYSVLGRYAGSDEPVLHKHHLCGCVWKTRPRHFIHSSSRCPYCSESRGERRVREYLTAHSYAFTPQYTFDDCRDVNSLRFDFAVHFRNYDVLIEYDGIQHSEPVDFAGKGAEWAERQFRDSQRKDRIKTEYCRANGIPLIRIDYTQFDEIEEILTRELTKLGVTGKRPIAQETEEATAA